MSNLVVALSGGGAAGLGHIPVLEALDEIGVRPKALAGSSMGAVVAVAYAAGLSGADLRAHVLDMLDDPLRPIWLHVKQALGKFRNPLAELDGEAALRAAWPDGLVDRLEDLGLPVFVVATDYHARKAHVFRDGPILPALGASISIPGVFAPARLDGRLMIDGGVTNNLPLDVLPEGVCLAVDVASAPPDDAEGTPGPMALVAGSMRVMMRALLEARLQAHPPAVFVQPESRRFGALDFGKAREILEAADPIKETVKRKVEKALAA